MFVSESFLRERQIHGDRIGRNLVFELAELLVETLSLDAADAGVQRRHYRQKPRFSG